MTNTNLRTSRRSYYAFVFASIFSGAAFADCAEAQTPQVPSPVIRNGEQQQSLETQRLRAQQLERQSRSFQTLSTEKRLTQCPIGNTEHVMRLEFSGVKYGDRAVIQEIFDRHAGKAIDCNGLEKIAADIYDVYDRAGYPLTQVHPVPVPDQPGSIRFVIIEARIGDSGFCKNGKLRRGLNNAFPIRRGQQFTMSALDQGIDNLNQLDTFNQAVPLDEQVPQTTEVDCLHRQGSTVTIKPGNGDGQGVVTVQTIQKRPFFVTAGADNLGNQSTGQTRVNGQIAIEDLLGLYERFEIAGSHTTDFSAGADHARNLSGAVTAPAGYWRFTLSGNYFDYRSTVALANQSFVTSGDQAYYAVDVDRVLSRNQSDRLIAGATLSIKDTHNFVNGLRLSTGSRRLTLLSGRIAYDHGFRDNGGGFAGTLSLTQGINLLGALDGSQLTRAQPHAQYTQVGLTLSYRRELPLGKLDKNGRRSRADSVRLQSLFSGSFAPHALYGTEQVQIGGPFTVRGFDDASLNGDIGGFVRNEASYITPFPPFGHNGQVGVFGAVDGGWIIRNYVDQTLEKALAGVAGGLRANARNMRAEARVEKSIASPSYLRRSGAIFRFTIALSI